jgi:O-antigen/teichoic acid export membrane protein
MKSWDMGDKEETGRLLSSITEWFANIGIMFASVVWVFSGDISALLLGKEFHQGHIIMPFVVGGIVLWQMAQYVHKPLEFSAKTGLMMKLGLAAAVFGLLTDIILVPIFGYVAAAWVTFASYLSYIVMAGFAGKSIIKWRINWKSIIRTLLIATAVFNSVLALRNIMEPRYGYVAGLVSSVAIYILIITICMTHSNMLNIKKRLQ